MDQNKSLGDRDWEILGTFSSSDSDIERGFDVLSPVPQRSQDEIHRVYEEIPEPLKAGDLIVIKGTPTANCQSFAINLVSNKSGDIAFHFNPRFLPRYIVRNSRLRGQWGDEETLCPLEFPFSREEPFELEIFVTSDKFFVSVNERHICSFDFVLNLVRIDHINAEGGVTVKSIEYNHRDDYPQRIDSVDIGNELESLDVPLVASLPEGLDIGWQLEIYGQIKLLPHYFSIKLLNTFKLWPLISIPLIITFNLDSNTLSQNSLVNNKLDREERSPNQTISPNSQFKIGIRRGVKKFTLWINDKLQCEYLYRASPENIKYVKIEGDIRLHNMVINKHPDNGNIGQ